MVTLRVNDKEVPTNAITLRLIGNQANIPEIEALKHYYYLVSLDLQYNQINNEGARLISQYLCKTSSLTKLNLNVNQIGPAGGSYIALALNENSSLTDLNLANNKLGSDGVITIANSLVSNSSLTSLNLKGNGMGEEAAIILARSLLVNPSLVKLNIRGIGTKGANELAQSLLANFTITDLNLRDNQIENVEGIATILATNSCLSKLNLRGNCLDLSVIKILANALHTNVGLTHLDMSDNRINSEGAKWLEGAIQINTSLTKLNLIGTDIENKRAVFLRESLRVNVELSKISNFNVNTMATSIPQRFVNSAKIQRLLKIDELSKQYPLHTTKLERFYFQDLHYFENCAKTLTPRFSHACELLDSVQAGESEQANLFQHLKEIMGRNEEWQKMKVIVIGHGQIGKTTLISHMHDFFNQHNNEYQSKSSTINQSTIGIEQSSLNLCDNASVVIWDFAGQMEYTVTHQYFISNKLVTYLVCFDLSLPLEEQQSQMDYWLNYLNSILFTTLKQQTPPTARTTTTNEFATKWRIIVVGTRADLSKQPSSPITVELSLENYPFLPIHSSIFQVSTKKESPHFSALEGLCGAIKKECLQILEEHTKEVPCAFQDLRDALQSSPLHILHEKDISKIQPRWATEPQLVPALDFLQSIGEIVKFGEGKICTKPMAISLVLAKFISSDEHREQINPIFMKTRLESIRSINAAFLTDEVRADLDFLHTFGVCFPVPVTSDPTSTDVHAPKILYLFPSIQHKAEFCFKNPPNRMKYSGFRIIAPDYLVFTPGYFCSLVTTLCFTLKISNLFPPLSFPLHSPSPLTFAISENKILFVQE